MVQGYEAYDDGEAVIVRRDVLPDTRSQGLSPSQTILGAAAGLPLPHLAVRTAVTVADLLHIRERVVHLSHGDGIYVGRSTRTGKAVVCKEGRPHAFSMRGAVTQYALSRA